MRGPDEELLQAISWDAADGAQSYMVPVQQPGEHEILVTHIGRKDGQMVEATESATFNIGPMIITVIDLVPGSIGVINVVGGEAPEPIDLNGYWDFYPTVEGEGELFFGVLPFQQTGTELLSAHGLSGSIIGTSFFLEGYFEEDDTVLHGVMEGTASPTEITGEYTDLPFGDGTFRFVPSEMPFGHLDVSGTFNGQPVSLDTEYGLARSDSDSFYGYQIGLNVGGLYGLWIGTEDRELGVGEFHVDEDEWFGLDLNDNYGQHEATAGWINITAYSETGMTGTFDLYFSDGHLTGTFHLIFGASGEASVDGIWMGNPVSGSTTAAYAERHAQVVDRLEISYLDPQLQVDLWISANGSLHTGVTVSPDAWVTMRWLEGDGDGDEEDEILATSCELHIDALSAEAVAGGITAFFEGGDSVTANFAMDFAPESED